ncbi:NAD(P)H-quinone oxidoreductase [Subtercola boreus]|uniref:NADPH:quinone oxidoreductase n=1 Tax=Subtercola boreus TaxID=120213 RepID=A0A3E0W8Y8_9MICO|nr:NAD(P)H-quinone oxidoreductase [Subtercola boreus]RFA18778.1 NADPH:quinone oxidoreductase [Subtercola boreus]RFA18895.1 NADPH:quinone oxidoreductase [Subtercola boreus]RFA25430.1 NADPH:quinone oxidoreductase [Subtercola boreus]
MKAVIIQTPGDADVLQLAEVDEPQAGPGEVVVGVVAAGVNRADISQREGHYPPPPGAPAWPGLEVSGLVLQVGDGVTTLKVGDRVAALLSGGGYAERVSVPAGQVIVLPPNIDLIDGAALIEVAATVWSNVFLLGDLRAGETLLVHGGSSGIGTMAIQLARARGARVAVTAGSAEKLSACEALGASILINYRTEDFVERLKDEAVAAHVILDSIGGSYLARNVQALATDGHIVNIGNLSQEPGTLDFGPLMMKRGAIHATSLRGRSAAAKAAIVDSVRENVWPLVADASVRPVVSERFPLARAADAHRLMEGSTHIGKIVLVV